MCYEDDARRLHNPSSGGGGHEAHHRRLLHCWAPLKTWGSLCQLQVATVASLQCLLPRIWVFHPQINYFCLDICVIPWGYSQGDVKGVVGHRMVLPNSFDSALASSLTLLSTRPSTGQATIVQLQDGGSGPALLPLHPPHMPSLLLERSS